MPPPVSNHPTDATLAAFALAQRVLGLVVFAGGDAYPNDFRVRRQQLVLRLGRGNESARSEEASESVPPAP